MKTLFFTLLLSITASNTYAASNVKLVRVFKSERRLELVDKDNQVIKTYKIMLGRQPVGHKTQEGDNKTPEGVYELDAKNPESKFNKAFHISYPNKADKFKAKLRRKDPGGEIMLHGLPNDFKELTTWLDTVGLGSVGDDIIRSSLPFFDWTWGCIAVTDAEINEIYSMVDVPTKIIINP
jgi:murein L,D-transpeptidase YafK